MAVAEELVVGAVLTAVGVALAPFALEVLTRVARGRVVFFARWGFSHVIQVVLVWILAQVGCAAVARAAGVPDGPSLAALALNVVAFGVTAAWAGVLARRLHPEGLAALGLGPGTGRAVAAGLLVYLLLLPGVVGLQGVGAGLFEVFGGEPGTVALDVVLSLSGAELAAAVALAVVAVPVVEEVIFRGFLQPLLVQNLGEGGGVVVTSVLFAVLHPMETWLPILGLSCVLGVLQLKTRRLGAAVAVHASHNGLVLATALLWPEAMEILR